MFDWLKRKLSRDDQPHNDMLRFGGNAAFRDDTEAPRPAEDRLCKVLMVGESGSGKSAFIARVSSNRFNSSHCCTIGVEFASRTIKVNGVKVRLQMWDTAGQERFRSVTRSYYRGAHGCFLMADASNMNCIEALEHWVAEVVKHAGSSVPIVVLATKTDVSVGMEPHIKQFADDRGFLYATCSSKAGTGLEEALTMLTLAMIGSDASNDAASAVFSWDAKKEQREHKAVTDVNVFNINLSGVEKEAPLVTGDPCMCTNCGVLLSARSKLESARLAVLQTGEVLPCLRAPAITEDFDFVESGAGHCPDISQGGFRTWDCEFCGKRNFVEMEDDELPQSTVVDFIVRPKPAAGDSAKNVVFCLDVSGSMCVTSEVRGVHRLKGSERLRAAKEKMARDLGVSLAEQYSAGQRRNATMISRLQCVQAAIEQQMEQLSREEPATRVGLVTFNNEVTVVGDGSAPAITVAGDRLDNWNELEAFGQTLSLARSIGDAKAELVDHLWDLEEAGGTALGPAVLLSIVMAGKQPGSHVVLCTDGKANVGVGSLEEEKEGEIDLAYTQLAELAKVCGVVVSVVSIIGNECRLDHLGIVADETGGSTERVNPVDLVKDSGKLGCLLNKPVLAYGAMAMVILHRALQFNGEMDDENEMEDEAKNRNFIVKDIGTINAGMELPLSYKFRSREGRDFTRFTEVPFQVQILYTRPDGTCLLRVATAELKVTNDRASAATEESDGLLAAIGARRAGQLARAGQLGDAKAEIAVAQSHLVTAHRDRSNEQVLDDIQQNIEAVRAALDVELSRGACIEQLDLMTDQLDETSTVFRKAAKAKTRLFW